MIDALGRDDADITFSGIFYGGEATLRARLLDEMRATGALLPLTWDAFFYTVVIARFQAKYTKVNWIPFRITCTILRDEASATIDSVLSLGAIVENDIGAAITPAAAAGVDISSLQTGLSDPLATVRDTTAYSAVQSSLLSAQATVSSAMDAAQMSLPSSGVMSQGAAVEGVSEIAAAVDAAQNLSQLLVAQSFIGRASINLANAST